MVVGARCIVPVILWPDDLLLFPAAGHEVVREKFRKKKETKWRKK